ncbi:MAG: peroxide stress protein YaaA [Candidatus Methanoperedens sp.]|nr:peroxide stress protein YaaA [Candidatus Methanoperedens sp.]
MDENALILIPCSKQKNIVPVQGNAQPLPDTQLLRYQLLQLIQQTPNLVNRQENQRGILNIDAPVTQSINFYVGQFYRVAGNVLHEVLSGQYPSINVLIVSALYGLIELDENLSEYELQMGDRLNNGMKVYNFWQRVQLWQILQNYIIQNNITHVWSLLPDSMPDYPYHRIFNELWKQFRNTKTQCFHVQVPGAGTGTGYKRSEWLVETLNTNPDYLHGISSPPNQLRNIPGYEFRYETC